MGELSSTRRPTALTIRSMTRIRCLSSWKVPGTRSSTPWRSTYTCLNVFTRMSLMVGSRSSGSSGPSPKTSSRMSLRICSRSAMVSGWLSSLSNSNSSVRMSPSARARSTEASASRFSRFSSFRWTFAFSWMYCGRGGSWRAGRPGPALEPEPSPRRAATGGAMIEAVDMEVYLLGHAGSARPDPAYQLKKLKLSADFFFSTAWASADRLARRCLC